MDTTFPIVQLAKYTAIKQFLIIIERQAVRSKKLPTFKESKKKVIAFFNQESTKYRILTLQITPVNDQNENSKTRHQLSPRNPYNS